MLLWLIGPTPSCTSPPAHPGRDRPRTRTPVATTCCTGAGLLDPDPAFLRDLPPHPWSGEAGAGRGPPPQQALGLPGLARGHGDVRRLPAPPLQHDPRLGPPGADRLRPLRDRADRREWRLVAERVTAPRKTCAKVEIRPCFGDTGFRVAAGRMPMTGHEPTPSCIAEHRAAIENCVARPLRSSAPSRCRRKSSR